MSENAAENAAENEPTNAIPDEQLPPDLVPGDDNPLAEGLPPGEGGDLLDGGKTADEMEEDSGEDAEEKRSGPAHEHD